MINLSYSQMQDFLNQTDLTKFPALSISILRNVMVEPVVPFYQYLGSQIGFHAQVVLGGYDNAIQEAVSGSPTLLSDKTDVVIVFLKLETLSWDLARRFSGLSREQIASEVARVKSYISTVIQGIRQHTHAMILWHGFELPVYPGLGIHDLQASEGQITTIEDLNRSTQEVLRAQMSAYFVSSQQCLAKIGSASFYDLRYWHIGRAPYSRAALKEFAEEDFKFVRALKGKNKKCLVLDCDNVLWGGVIGEDGLSGIKLGKTYPGSAFCEFQQQVVELYNRGVIIALCSKNNADDVWEVFRKHPDMVLKEEHIACAEINWEDKVANIKRIAANLNIGLDSLLFVDDSEFEINMVKDLLPEVETLWLPKDKAVEARDALAGGGWFDTLTLSEEDRKRGELYRSEVLRKELKEKTTNLGEYLESLEMVVEIARANDFAVPRIAQLTQKTNQFNLTTRRYSDADVKGMLVRKDCDVLYIKLADKLGDSGIIGVCIINYEAQRAVIDTLLLSCRILGRGVEEALLTQISKLATQKGCKEIVGQYIPTKKNGQVKDFYQGHGFKAIAGLQPQPKSEGESFFYSRQIVGEAFGEPKHFKSITWVQ